VGRHISDWGRAPLRTALAPWCHRVIKYAAGVGLQLVDTTARFFPVVQGMCDGVTAPTAERVYPAVLLVMMKTVDRGEVMGEGFKPPISSSATGGFDDELFGTLPPPAEYNSVVDYIVLLNS